MAPRILERYQTETIDKLKEEFSFRNIHQVPKLTKIVLNVGLGEAAANPKLLDRAVEELTLIAGQKAVIRKARKSVLYARNWIPKPPDTPAIGSRKARKAVCRDQVVLAQSRISSKVNS